MFFEEPVVVAGDSARFPQLLSTESRLYRFYQESEETGPERGEIYVSFDASADGVVWQSFSRKIGPVPFSGATEPFVYAALVTKNGTIYIAVTESADRTVIYRSANGGVSFREVHELRTERTNVAPRLFEMRDGSVVLFVNENVGGLQTIVGVHSANGSTWGSPFTLEPSAEVGLTFLPIVASNDSADYVVFQGINLGVTTTYQLYVKASTDGGRTWGDTKRITTFVDPSQTVDPEEYDNQRADFVANPEGDGFSLLWERRFQGGSPQLFLAELSPTGELTGFVEEVTGRFDLARFPRIAFDGDERVLVWFTNPRGVSRVILGQRGQVRWRTRTVSSDRTEATFASIAAYRGRLHVTWQRREGDEVSRVVYLEPDQRVNPPSIVAENFRAGEKSAVTLPQFRLVDPPDVSGIRAYAYEWARRSTVNVPETARLVVPDRRITEDADEDGEWFLLVRANDFAGNWSEPAVFAYERDTTPPPAVTFPPPPIDENAYLASNTFDLEWDQPDVDDLAGYSVRFDYLGLETDLEIVSIPALPVSGSIDLFQPTLSRTNIDDGLWLLTVAPVDGVGNVGEPASLPVRLNKYVPVTEVYSTGVERDPLGRYVFSIAGRGFDANGTIHTVFFDRDGVEPYEYEYKLRRGDYAVTGDREIEDLLIEEVTAGTYQLGLIHEERGPYIAALPVVFESRGTVKFGDFSIAFLPAYNRVQPSRFSLSTTDALVYSLVAVGAALALLSILRLVSIGREAKVFQLEARALLERKRPDQLQLEEMGTRMKVAGIGLRGKFAFFIVLLVFSVVLMVAVVLGRSILDRQERILVAGLKERAELLVEGMATGSRTALDNPQLTIEQLQTFADQADAMDDALYATITGLGQVDGSVGAVYATNDPQIIALLGDSEPSGEGGDRIDTDTYIVGISRVQDEISDEIERLAGEVNIAARDQVGAIPIQLAELSVEAQRLILAGASEADIQAIDEVRTSLLRQAREALSVIGGGIQSFPEYNATELDPSRREYLFYKPVLNLVAGAGEDFSDYYRGTVRVAVSTQLIVDEVAATRRDIITSTSIVAALTVVFGIVGAYVLATLVVVPINRLVDLVTQISATENKEQLKGVTLDLRSRDELRLLADSINDMTAGLVKAAEANKDLMFGKETQKMFIPLEKVTDDRKRTTGELVSDNVHFFGYYEGAKGVSGDYFAYEPLDDRHYAMIKCDVAGKGIPASLIMVQVATVFLDYFRAWTRKNPGFQISSMVERMNDLIEERGFKGRFAALTTGILDARTGKMYLSNAGDNQIHIYRAADGTVEQSSLSRTPAAGVFPTEMSPIGFPQEELLLNRGDILLLFTDGLEEAQRKLRGGDYGLIQATEEHNTSGLLKPPGLPAETAEVGAGHEELGIGRIHQIVSAVRSRGRFELQKVLNPARDETLVLDFSASDGGVKDAVMAVVAVEKLFRLYRSPTAGADTKIRVDKVIDTFLQNYFLQYSDYFGSPVRGDDEEYAEFTYLQEDEQYDDITLLAVERT